MDPSIPERSLQNTSPPIDPADVTNLMAAYEQQSTLLQGYQEQLTRLQAINEHLTGYIQALPSTSVKRVSVSEPDKFDGTAEHVRGFLRQLDIYFQDHVSDKLSDSAMCYKVFSLLTGKAVEWASAVWDNDPRIRTSYSYFVQQIKEVFEYPAGGRSASLQIINMTQNHRPVAEYAIEFRTLAAQSGWNDRSLKDVFQNSLDVDLQAELACKGENLSFSDFVTLAVHIDNLMRNVPARMKLRASDRPMHDTSKVFHTAVTTNDGVEPMQMGFAPLTMAERQRRREKNLCFYCGKPGHRIDNCPAKKPRNTSTH